MAVARAEIILPSPNPLWFNLATEWIMKDLQNRLGYPLEADVRGNQERVTVENKKLHEAARKLELALIPVAIAALAIVGWNNKDQIASALNLSKANQAPNPANVIGVPESTLASFEDLKTPTLRPTETLTPTRLPTFTLAPTETHTPTATVTETAATPLIPSEYALKAAGELGEGAKAMRFLISNFEGKYDGLYGKEWYYAAESEDKKWILAIFANYYDPTTGKGNICLKGDCRDLVGKEIDIIVPPGPEYYDPEGKLHGGRPYVYAAAIIEGEK